MPTQRLQQLHTSQVLQAYIEDLRQKNKTLGDQLKMWANEALKLSQDADVAIKQLNQTLESVATAIEGELSEKLVNIAQNVDVQSKDMLPLLAEVIRVLQVQVEAPPT